MQQHKKVKKSKVRKTAIPTLPNFKKQTLRLEIVKSVAPEEENESPSMPKTKRHSKSI